MEERLQKILSRAGFGSRRSCEELIAKGRVTVNGRLVTLGDKADPAKDQIEVNGRPVEIQDEEPVYIALNKPRGVLSAAKPQDKRKTVRELIDEPGHLYPVGRLDVDSEGLILMTNDGELANRLTHPRYGHEKEYKVLVARRPDEEQLAAWRNGIVLADGHRTAPAQVFVSGTYGKGAWLKVILKEGRNRQIREMGALTGLPVVRIVRIRIGSLWLGNLKPRQYRRLEADEVRDLLSNAPAAQGRFRTRGAQPARPKSHASRKSDPRTPGSRPPGSRPFGQASRPGSEKPSRPGETRPKRLPPRSKPKER